VADKTRTGPLFAKLSAMAPYPDTPATAAGTARWLAAQGLLTAARQEAGTDADRMSLDLTHLLGAQYAAAAFLTALAAVHPGVGDVGAAQAVADWGAAGSVIAGELRGMLGNDAEEVAAVAGELAAAMAEPDAQPSVGEAAAAKPGRLARVEVKGFRNLGIVRVTETTLAGEAMLHAESDDGSSADFPPSSLHFITWLPESALDGAARAELPVGAGGFDPRHEIGDDDSADWDERNPF